MNNRNTFIADYQQLFWYFDKSKLDSISDAVLVEFILNYGDLEAVKRLFEVLGKEKVAKEFAKAIRNNRNNYFPQVSNFFNLYFRKYVPQYPFA
jgi:hypothetical protein